MSSAHDKYVALQGHRNAARLALGPQALRGQGYGSVAVFTTRLGRHHLARILIRGDSLWAPALLSGRDTP